MTREEFFKLKVKVTKECTDKLKEYRKRYEDGIRYFTYDRMYMNYTTVQFNPVDYDDIEDMIYYAKEFNDKYKEDMKKSCTQSKMNLQAETSDWGDEDAIQVYDYSFYELKDTVADTHIKSKIKEEFSKILNPFPNKSPRTPDCKLMELYKDGTIDFKALQKLVYSDCGI